MAPKADAPGPGARPEAAKPEPLLKRTAIAHLGRRRNGPAAVNLRAGAHPKAAAGRKCPRIAGFLSESAGAPNPKCAHTVRRTRPRTSGSKGHQNHRVASGPLIPKFVPTVPQSVTNFGIGPLGRGRVENDFV
jgi:hypothetical protein